MADSFFGFDTSIAGSGLDDAIDCPIDEDEIAEEDEYDALNDETFGSEAVDGDWEQDHEKLAQITELTRPISQPPKNTTSHINKNGLDVDIEGSLSHLVLDEKDGIVPRPGVWDSPSIPIPLQKKQRPHVPPPVKNVCTVEELERGLIRPPPGLQKPQVPTQLPQQQQQQQQQQPPNCPTGQFIIDYSGLNDHLPPNLRPNILNGMPIPRFPPGLPLPGSHPVPLPPNVRIPNQLLQNARPMLPNQTGNIIRFPLPPHLMMAGQRQPLHGNFVGNFPPPPRPNLGPPQFHPLIIPFANISNHQQQQLQQLHAANQRNQNRTHQGEQQQQQQQQQSQPNHQPFFKNNQFWHQNRNNPRFQNRQHHQAHNGLNGNGEYDEYAGLMNSREKQWLTNIQLLQHNTNQPFFDDYYFTVFCERQNKKNDSPDGKDKKQNNNGYNRDSRDKDQHVLTKVVYTPTQFENSLGKLQCGSVTAPRKIIDMDVVPNSDPGQNPPAQLKDMKKARQRLLEIERLYTVQLKLEDINNPLAQLAEKHQAEQQQQNPEQESEPKVVKKTAPELISIMLSSLVQLLKEDKLSGILSVRKGKTLLLRFLPYLSVTEYANQLGELWVGLIRGLAVVGRRDPHLLVRFFGEFHRWLETARDFSVVLQLATAFLDSANQNNKNNNSLAFAVTNKFGVSVIASLLEQAENLYPEDENMIAEWSKFIVNLADVTGLTPPCVAPCQPIAANTLHQHLKRIKSLKTARYEPLESLLTDANPSR